jgi:hypothetical protein
VLSAETISTQPRSKLKSFFDQFSEIEEAEGREVLYEIGEPAFERSENLIDTGRNGNELD